MNRIYLNVIYDSLPSVIEFPMKCIVYFFAFRFFYSSFYYYKELHVVFLFFICLRLEKSCFQPMFYQVRVSPKLDIGNSFKRSNSSI